MRNETNLGGLFGYYKYTLSIENVLSFSISQTDLDYPDRDICLDYIRNTYTNSVSKQWKPFFTEKEIPQYLVSENGSYDNFFRISEFIEKTLSLEKEWSKKGKILRIEDHPAFKFGESSHYQYGVVVDFAKVSPKSNFKPTYLPCLVFLFDNIDRGFNTVSPNMIFEQIKRFLDLPYDKTIDDKDLREPELIHNPKILEPYNIKFEEFSRIKFKDGDELASLFSEVDRKHLVSGTYICAFGPKMTHGLIKIYESIKKNKPNQLMLDYFNVCSSKKTKAHTETFNPADVIDTEKVVNAALSHYGAFDKQYCLSETQRVAFTCYLQGRSIVPVNGAPGTGKTSLLRAIAGDYIVKAALESYDTYKSEGKVKFKTPIVCTSTNNQALHNISEGIETGFNSAKDGLLYQRWIDAKLDRKYKKNKVLVEDKLDFGERLFVPSIKTMATSELELSKSDILQALTKAMSSPEVYIGKFEEFTEIKFPEKLILREKLEKCIEYLFEKIDTNINVIKDTGDYGDAIRLISDIESMVVKHYYKEDKEWQRDLFYLLKIGDVTSAEKLLESAEEPFIEEYDDFECIHDDFIDKSQEDIFRETEQAKKDAGFISRVIYSFFKKGALADRITNIEAKYQQLAIENTYEMVSKLIPIKVLQLAENLEKVKNFFDNKDKLDTSLRTDNFYYSLHLLEALFLLQEAAFEGRNHLLICPSCKQKIMYKVQKTGNYYCKVCKLTCVISNLKDILSEPEIEYILNEGGAVVNGQYCEVVIKKPFINIYPSMLVDSAVLKGLLPIFPIINITCNSMGTILSEKDTDGNNIVRNDVVDFMLIDEAGTITPSKMAVLYCAKQAMFFGDVKQLKPVYSFDSAFEKKVLERYLDNEDIKFVSHYFSCSDFSNTKDGPKGISDSMSIANNCCEFFLPYNKSKLEGDIWLKEHYRCSESIIQIANEMTYEGEIVPCKKDSPNIKHLEFIDHQEQRNPANNTNEGEAEFIINYIRNNMTRLMSQLNITSHEELYDSIGIVTPFRNQHFLLESMLKDNDLSAVKVGTVHKFQGSERRIIIFSSVYSSGSAEAFFFNRGESDMLNVTVTRAKDMFICFGHKDLLNVESTFSGVMVKHIEDCTQ